MVVIYILLFLILVIVLFWQITFFIATLTGAPSVFANQKAVYDGIKLAKAESKSTKVFLDLGCGDGRSLIIASKQFGMKAIGIERNYYCFLLARIKCRLSRCENVRVLFGDFRKYEEIIQQADLIYIYLLNSVLANIEEWLFQIKPDKTRVVSLCFEFKKHDPMKTAPTVNLGHKTILRLY